MTVGDLTRQLDAARTTVLAVPHPELATLIVTGGDRVSWLNGLVTCDLTKRGPGNAMYGLVVARNGRVQSDVIVVFDEPGARLLLTLPRDVTEAIRGYLDHYLVMEDAEISAGAQAMEAWALHGPLASEVFASASASGAVGGLIDRTGLGGGVLLIAEEVSASARVALEEAVRAVGGLVGDPAGWEALRLERGVPRFGVDFDDKTYPQEASLEKVAVSFDKGCYLGQEVVFMLEKRGHVKRRLVPVLIGGSLVPERGTAVTDETGASIGEVTSAAQSPTAGGVVALAMLKRAYAESGKRVSVAGAVGQVVDRPA